MITATSVAIIISDGTKMNRPSARNLEEASADLVDIITFHDYLQSASRIEASWETAEAVARKYNKPLMNSETAWIWTQ